MRDEILPVRKGGRVFLRVSTEIFAEVADGNTIIRKARLENLSTDGLAFITGEVEAAKLLGPFFNVRFSLPHSSAAVVFKVEKKNQAESDAKITISCAIIESSAKDRNALNNYLRKSTELGLPYALMEIAAFLCSIDALWRILARAIYRYYSYTQFGRGELASLPLSWQDAALAGYVLMSFASFAFLSGWIRIPGSWRRFPLGVACLSFSAIFLAGRLTAYAIGRSLAAFDKIPPLFFWIQAALFAYVVLSIAVAIPDIARVRSVFSAIKRHK